MSLHANTKLGLAGRLALVRAIEDGLSLKAAAAAVSVSPATALAGRTLQPHCAHKQEISSMELAGLEPATSWVR